MCGIAGFFDPRRNAGKAELERIASSMASALRHRGPDAEGAWADAQTGVALGHRRLAILDLSREGSQPMRSADGKYMLVFNGEIYNFEELRIELTKRGHFFRGRSDTEVLLAGFSEWGIVQTLRRCIGMFALGVWDRRSRRLLLARDRAGEKPLYHGWTGNVFIFGSELKALRKHPCWEAGIDHGAVASLIRYGYIPAPTSIYEGIEKLPPGCVLELTESDLLARRTGAPEPYWSLQNVVQAAAAYPFGGGESEATGQLHSLLLDSVRQQMVADVPLGAFLSGGIDSTLVVALMQAQSRRPIKTFCIGFHQDEFDEAPFAMAVSRHLGTDHSELYVHADELLQVISRLPAIYDEPFADTSQIPTVLLCELARLRVTVSLSGDGGDELFGGYEDYRKAQRLWPVLKRIPQFVRDGTAKPLEALSALGLGVLNHSNAVSRVLGRAANLATILPARTEQNLYRLLMSPNRRPLQWLRRKNEKVPLFDSAFTWAEVPDLLHRMMAMDFVGYLPDDILVKVDRAAMSTSLETRIPFLDHRVIEFAWSLPASLKQRQGRGKWLLRHLLRKYVPGALIDRPKKGFNVPIAEWLRGSLRQWAEALLSGERLRAEGFFDAEVIRQKWMEHQSGKRDLGQSLWHVLMFQSWLESQRFSRPLMETRPVESVAYCENGQIQIAA